ncbi:hypothetical protein DMA11_25380, partial [Marinilabiliaceae bacterium JC017]
AQGNVMSVYKERDEKTVDKVSYNRIVELAEQPIYGSSRLGMRLGDGLEVKRTFFPANGDPVERAVSSQATKGLCQRLVGDKQYELTDHLGNVRAVITDRLVGMPGVIEAREELTPQWQRSLGMEVAADGIALNNAH